MKARLRAARMAAIACVCAAALPAAARGWYVAASIGSTEVDGASLANRHAIEFDPGAERSSSERRDSWRVGGGCQLNERFGVELSYSDYGRQTLSVSGSPNPIVFPPEVLSESRVSDRKVDAWGVDVVARMPVISAIALVARAGVAYATVKTSSHTVAPGGFPFGRGPQDFSTTARDRSFAPRLALGAAWSPAPAWDVQLVYEHLGKVGSDFTAGEARTGRASESSAWLTLVRHF